MTSINQARKLVEFYAHAAYLNKSKKFMWYERSWVRSAQTLHEITNKR